MTLTVPELLGILALALGTAKFLASRLDAIKVDNAAAHAAITENVKENRRQIAALTEDVREIRGKMALAEDVNRRQTALAEDIKEIRGQMALAEDVKEIRGQMGQMALAEDVKENRRQIATLGARVDTIAVDVAYLRGRQEERDRAEHVPDG